MEAVEKALGFVMRPKMKFIFSDLSRITKTLTVSYDSKFIYIWKIDPAKLINKIPHNVVVPDEWQSGWWANLAFKKLERYLPQEIRKLTRFEMPIISGGLLTPFIELQEKKDLPYNSYTTEESYFATIIHEFGHVYWNSYKLWWYSNKKESLEYLQNPSGKLAFHIPSPLYLSEVFAFCTEYYASGIFLENHKRNLDRFLESHTKSLTVLEKDKNLDKENSVIEPTTSPHDFAFVLGKTVLEKYPKDWPAILTKLIQI